MNSLNKEINYKTFNKWDTFISTYWQKEPTVLHDSILATPQEIFDTSVLVSHKMSTGSTDAPYLKLYVNGQRITENLSHYLPQAADISSAGYEKRLERELNAQSFILFITGFERYNATLYDRVQEFLGHLFQYTGIPVGHAELELFLGRYTYTPGGIHNEECTNFQWVIDGNKTMHTWPEATWNTETLAVSMQHDPTSQEEEHFLDDVRLDDHRKSSQPLRGQPGDILYWPSRYWHVGETPELSMALTLAVYMKGRPSQTILQTAMQLIEQKLDTDLVVPAYPFPSSTHTTLANTLPASLQQPLDSIKDIINGTQLQQALIEQWLKRASNLGLAKTLDLLPAKIPGNSDVVYRISQGPILCTQLDERTFLYAIHGHCDTISTPIHLVELLAFLNTGESVTIKELIARYSTTSSGKAITDIYHILTFLYQARAINVQENRSA